MPATDAQPGPTADPADPGPRSGRGYLASVVGALAGAAAGAAGGLVLGPAGFTFALGHVHARPADGGLTGAIEGVGIAVGTAVFAAAVAALVVVFGVWLGAVVGCGVALRVRGHAGAGTTALTFGAVAPLTFLTLAVVVGRFVEVRGDTAVAFHSLWIGLAACLARRLTAGRG